MIWCLFQSYNRFSIDNQSSHSRIYVPESRRKTNNHAHILDYKHENTYGK